ncbi:pyridoxal phosphate-dependent transferase [Zopfochytrium polystomum]|nr:pyridoxal phosphate-dependent transferase [Zopfochytrium polystomum]
MIDAARFLNAEAKARKPSSLKSLYPIMIRPGMRALAGGLPHPDLFATQDVSATLRPLALPAVHSVTVPTTAVDGSASSSRFLQYGPGTGWPETIKLVKEVMIADKGPQYEDWDLMMTHGNSSAFEICTRVLFSRGDGLLVEHDTLMAWGAAYQEYSFSSYIEKLMPLGIIPVPVKLDKEGLVPSDIPRALAEFKAKYPGGRCNVLYTVPTGQNPTGTVMGVDRRVELLNVCKQLDLLVIEDDPYSYLHVPDYNPDPAARESYVYRGTKGLAPSLLSLDTDGRVIMMFTFSKIMAPGFRLGFMAGYKPILTALIQLSEGSVQSASGFPQAIVHEILRNFKAEGLHEFAIDIQKAYTRRRDRLVDAAFKYLTPISDADGPLVDFVIPEAGMFLAPPTPPTPLLNPTRPKIALTSPTPPSRTPPPPRINPPPNAPATFPRDVFNALVARDVLFAPGEYFHVAWFANQIDALMAGGELLPISAATPSPYLRGSFSFVAEDVLEESVKIFGEVLREFGCGRRA